MVFLNLNIVLEISSFLERKDSRYLTNINGYIENNYSKFVKKFILRDFVSGVELKECITIWEPEGKFVEFYNIPCDNCELEYVEDENGHFSYTYNNIVNKKSVGYSKNQSVEGEYKVFWKNGNLKLKRFYHKGKPYGIVTSYYENGNRKVEFFINEENRENTIVKEYNKDDIFIKQFSLGDKNLTKEDIRIIQDLFLVA